mmetsp:Transcript_11084/g.18566  ORF Transcript_11084/g.18566 Transcript_11084/m.18566 type:complete len:190 (-) Transcript_11084:15-584(-)
MNRYFGSVCHNQKVMCAISPDAQFILSGSETGQPFIWEHSQQHSLDTSSYQCKFLDVISDCDWNPKYNMFAVCGFGQEFPVLTYVYERSMDELDLLAHRYGRLTSYNEQAFDVQYSERGGDAKDGEDEPSLDHYSEGHNVRKSHNVRASLDVQSQHQVNHHSLDRPLNNRSLDNNSDYQFQSSEFSKHV